MQDRCWHMFIGLGLNVSLMSISSFFESSTWSHIFIRVGDSHHSGHLIFGKSVLNATNFAGRGPKDFGGRGVFRAIWGGGGRGSGRGLRHFGNQHSWPDWIVPKWPSDSSDKEEEEDNNGNNYENGKKLAALAENEHADNCIPGKASSIQVARDEKQTAAMHFASFAIHQSCMIDGPLTPAVTMMFVSYWVLLIAKSILHVILFWCERGFLFAHLGMESPCFFSRYDILWMRRFII